MNGYSYVDAVSKDIDHYCAYAKTTFEHLGFDATRIPTHREEKRADLRISKNPNSFIVEVKCRIPKQDLIERVEKAKIGQIEEYVSELRHSGALSTDFKKAARQIAITRSKTDLFGCVFIILNPAFGIDFEKKVVRATLLGERGAFVKTKEGQDGHAPVFYAGFSDFYRYRDIDCAISIVEGGAELLCNMFSPRIANVRNSVLYQQFAEKNAVVDPSQLSLSDVYIAGEVDRRDENAVRAHLKAKYGDEFLALFDWTGAAGVAKAPFSGNK